MKRLTPKLMLVVGAVYAVAASPFVLGFCEPSIHEGFYPAIFTTLNIPALLVISSPVDWLEKKFFSSGHAAHIEPSRPDRHPHFLAYSRVCRRLPDRLAAQQNRFCG
jgi:hypothetical protein